MPIIPPETITQLLPFTDKITRLLCHPYCLVLTVPVLLYHLWVYIYLGHLVSPTYFYTGCLYSLNYGAVCVAYWILYRQHQSSVLTEMSNLVWGEKVWLMDVGGHQQLFNYYQQQLKKYDVQYVKFRRYCYCWECLMRHILLAWWGIALVNIVLNILHDTGLVNFYHSFDDHPLGLYGYFNLTGQFLASLAIMSAAVTMLTAFHQLASLIKGLAFHLRTYRHPDPDSPETIGRLTTQLRGDYLNIQGACLAYSKVWSAPIVVALTFCTQVLIMSIYVIHYSVKSCLEEDMCHPVMIFPFVWLFVAVAIMGIILHSVSKVNEVTSLIREAFIYSNGTPEGDSGLEDYRRIGGRQAWLAYLETNPLQFEICGVVVTPRLVFQVGYTAATAIGGFLASNLFSGD